MDDTVTSGIQATNDNHKSFPLYGSSQARPGQRRRTGTGCMM